MYAYVHSYTHPIVYEDSTFFFPKVFTPLKSMLVEQLIILPSADKSVSYDKFKRHLYGHLP